MLNICAVAAETPMTMHDFSNYFAGPQITAYALILLCMLPAIADSRGDIDTPPPHLNNINRYNLQIYFLCQRL